MIVVLLNGYVALLALFVWLRFIPFNLFWKLSPVLVLLVLLVGLFIPMGWGAPSGPAAVLRNSVQIVPSVAGEVVEVPVDGEHAGQGRRRPVPDRSDHLRGTSAGHRGAAQVRRTALVPADELQTRASAAPSTCRSAKPRSSSCAPARRREMEPRPTTVRAPADGYVTNLALRKGARVTAQSPVMAFIDTSETIFGVEIPQIYARYIAGRAAGRGHVQDIPRRGLHREGGGGVAGDRNRADAARRPRVRRPEIQPAPFVVRIKLDDQEVARRLPAGSTGARGDLHRPCQGEPRHPAGRAAADRHQTTSTHYE